MAAIVKELLIDINKLPIDIRCDLEQAIQQLCDIGIINRCELKFLDMFIQGYSAEEIALKCNKVTEDVRINLARIITAIEHTSQYLDQDFIHRVESSGKYSQHKIKKLTEFLKEHSEKY